MLPLFLAALALSGLLLLLAVGAGLLWWTRPPAPDGFEALPEGLPGVRALVAEVAELEAAFAALGTPVGGEVRLASLLAELSGELEPVVDDPGALQAALQAGFAGPAGEPEELRRARAAAAADPRVQALRAAGVDQEALLGALQRGGPGAPVPFLESLPVLTGGRVAFRPVVEAGPLAWRPRRRDRFRRLLEEIEGLPAAGPERPPEAPRRVREAARRLERALAHPRAYLPRPLADLEAACWHWWRGSLPPRARVERERLDGVLAVVVEARRVYGGLGAPFRRRPGLEREALLQAARRALDLPGAASPWLARTFLTYLLHRLALEVEGTVAGTRSPRRSLEALRDELAAGVALPAEVEGRLRSLEDLGVEVPSLTFALLRRVEGEGGRP